jgi:hypothetical protein
VSRLPAGAPRALHRIGHIWCVTSCRNHTVMRHHGFAECAPPIYMRMHEDAGSPPTLLLLMARLTMLSMVRYDSAVMRWSGGEGRGGGSGGAREPSCQ